MEIRAHQQGATLHLEEDEAVLLRSLLTQLRAAIDHGSKEDRVTKRLFPNAYESLPDQLEYQDLVGDQLQRAKLEAVADVERSLGDAGPAEVSLGESSLETWLATLTDMRLAIGTRLEIDEETMSRPLDADEIEAPELSVLHWLGWIQESVLEAID
jgi:hypothetical protein